MKIPQFLYSTTDDHQRYLALLVQALQGGLSDSGWTVPQLTAAQVVTVTNGTVVPYFNPVMPAGTIWFNTNVGTHGYR